VCSNIFYVPLSSLVGCVYCGAVEWTVKGLLEKVCGQCAWWWWGGGGEGRGPGFCAIDVRVNLCSSTGFIPKTIFYRDTGTCMVSYSQNSSLHIENSGISC